MSRGRSYVWDGWITSIEGDSFWTHLERNDEIIFIEFNRGEVRECDRDYIKEGAYLTLYIREECWALRFCKYVHKPSDIKWAEREAREMRDFFDGFIAQGSESVTS